MNNEALKILVVVKESADNTWVEKILQACDEQNYQLKSVQQLQEAVDIYCQDSYDVLLFDYSSQASQDLDSIRLLQQRTPQLPIVVLAREDNPELAIELMHQGVQDYLVTGNLEPQFLARSLRYAIARQRQQFELRQQALMKQMLDRIRNSIDLEAILQTTATVIQEFFASERVLIYRCAGAGLPETTIVSQSADAQFDREAIEQFIGAVNYPSLHAILSESTSVQIVEDTLENPRGELQVIEPQLVRSYSILPIWLSKSFDYAHDNFTLAEIARAAQEQEKPKLWGMLVAYNTKEPRRWQAWEIGFLQRLTTQVTIAIEQSQLCCELQVANQKLQKLAILDGLTGIANRRYFDLVLDKEWQRLAREQQHFSLILCDIDYFKVYNDTYGHQQGDRCLQKVAQILQQSTRRPADLVARYGGEEFALILPNTNAPGALFLAHQIVRYLAGKKIPHKHSPVSNFVTLSLGITTKIPDSKQPSSTIIEVADNLLYKAKRAGRNQVAVDNWLIASEAPENQ
ncbi:MAG: diguanylate cyclase [Cyanobacteria bacterium J06588_4]